MLSLHGRKALITGGTQGVGAAIAENLAHCGCDVIVHGLCDDEHCQETVSSCAEHGVQVEAVFQDLSGETEDCVGGLLGQIGDLSQIGLLVNNAGTFCDKPYLEMDLATLQRTMQLNVYSGYFLTQAFARSWIENGVHGRVLFTGSINGNLAEADHTAYDTSKGAVHSMVRSLCVALAPHGIRVNAMAPGLVVTPLTAPALSDKRAMEWMKLHTPNQKVPGPEACAPTAVFLLSDEAEHVHGQTWLVDGGMSVWQQPDPP
ncbi:MAG: SDR family oxidoreductase [Planctomycetota bacterium]